MAASEGNGVYRYPLIRRISCYDISPFFRWLGTFAVFLVEAAHSVTSNKAATCPESVLTNAPTAV